MASEVDSPGQRAYDRWSLLGEKRNELLELREVQQYGRDSFGDPGYVSLYGLAPADWYARGVRILGRTAVECTRDLLADKIGRDIAAVARNAAGVDRSVVVDLFAGSASTLYWIAKHVGARRGVGFELDDLVFELASKNLSLLGLDIELIHERYEVGLGALDVPDDALVIVFVAPPWGQALSEDLGLDLRCTTPPVSEVIELATTLLAGRQLLFAIQVYETVEPQSLAEINARFQSATLKVYDINARGQNHGLLLGTWGWTA
jgi:hypothetical protein